MVVSSSILSNYAHSLSVKVAVDCPALLLVDSNHFPASLLSPELYLLVISLGDTLGGLALSLACSGELRVVEGRPTASFVPT
jgi:hypothetical protein